MIFGSDRLIAGTRLMNLVFAQLAAFSFLGALLTLARNRGQALILMLIGFLVLFLVDERAQSIVALQQGSPTRSSTEEHQVRSYLPYLRKFVSLSTSIASSAPSNVFAFCCGASSKSRRRA